MPQAPDATAPARHDTGATDPRQAAPGTLRGDLGIDLGLNRVHGSDSEQSAEREIALFFEGHPLIDWHRDSEHWTFEDD